MSPIEGTLAWVERVKYAVRVGGLGADNQFQVSVYADDTEGVLFVVTKTTDEYYQEAFRIEYGTVAKTIVEAIEQARTSNT